jgi:hypothetical protein
MRESPLQPGGLDSPDAYMNVDGGANYNAAWLQHGIRHPAFACVRFLA